jgi:hypothetical protein
MRLASQTFPEKQNIFFFAPFTPFTPQHCGGSTAVAEWPGARPAEGPGTALLWC